MTLELNEQEHQYLLQVLLERPVKEALPMVLKLSSQTLVPIANVPPPASPSLRVAGTDG